VGPLGELGALFNPGMRHELEERRSKAMRREEEGNARDGDLRIDLESGVAVINSPAGSASPAADAVTPIPAQPGEQGDSSAVAAESSASGPGSTDTPAAADADPTRSAAADADPTRSAAADADPTRSPAADADPARSAAADADLGAAKRPNPTAGSTGGAAARRAARAGTSKPRGRATEDRDAVTATGVVEPRPAGPRPVSKNRRTARPS